MKTNTSVKVISGNGIQKLQVLFVDNNPSDHLYDMVGEIDFSNSIAVDAINKISEKQITCDAVVVDAAVDSGDLKTLRKLTNEKDLPLILYTSFFDQKIKDKAVRLKADDYLSGSMRYSLESRVKFIMRVRKLKTQWLMHEHKLKKQGVVSMWDVFQRPTDVAFSFFALILLSPLFLVLAIAQEIELMEAHVFSDAKNERLIVKIYNWYQFVVLILFSPIFATIKLPLIIMSKEKRLYTPYQNRDTWLDKVLIKKAVSGLSHLIDTLKGDTSLFEVTPLSVTKKLA